MGGRMGGTGGGAKRVREPSVPPGPRPLSNLELGLSSSSTTKRQRMEEPQDKVLAGTVIKGNSQKAGNKSVPDHLWLRAFVTGYGDASCGARHREALNLPTGDVGSLGAPEPPGEWRGAIPRFRIFALRYWRADMTRGYITWQRTNVPLPASNGSQMVRYQRQWGSNGEDLVYEWTGGGGGSAVRNGRTSGLPQKGRPRLPRATTQSIVVQSSNGSRAWPPLFRAGDLSTSGQYGMASPIL